MGVQHTQAMESFIEKFDPHKWDRVFGHLIGQTPSWGIPPEVFARWWAERESERLRLNNEARKLETERRCKAAEWKRQLAARVRRERAHQPYGGRVYRRGDQSLAVLQHGEDRYEYLGSKIGCYKWLLVKCRELGLTERGPEPPQYIPQESIDFIIANRGKGTRFIADATGLTERRVRRVLRENGEIYTWQHYDRQRKREIAAMAFKHDYADMTIPQLQVKYDLSRNMILSMAQKLQPQKSEAYKARRMAMLRERMRTKVQPKNVNAGARRKQLWEDERTRARLGLKRRTRFKVEGRPKPTVKAMFYLVKEYDYARTEDIWTLRRCGPHLPKNEKRFERKYDIKFID